MPTLQRKTRIPEKYIPILDLPEADSSKHWLWSIKDAHARFSRPYSQRQPEVTKRVDTFVHIFILTPTSSPVSSCHFLVYLFSVMIVAPDVWLSFLIKKLPEDQKDKTNLTIYGCLVGGSFIFAIIRAYVFLLVSLRCSERLHDKMVLAVLQAPVLFFDSNPVGRIMNRFSKDVGCLDEVLPKRFLMAIQMVLLVSTTVLVPTVTNPWLLFVVVPVIALLLYISRYYMKTSRELKRLESISRSPVFSHISETLNGLDTIRTRERQRDFMDQFYRYIKRLFYFAIKGVKRVTRVLPCRPRSFINRIMPKALSETH